MQNGVPTAMATVWLELGAAWDKVYTQITGMEHLDTQQPFGSAFLKDVT